MNYRKQIVIISAIGGGVLAIGVDLILASIVMGARALDYIWVPMVGLGLFFIGGGLLAASYLIREPTIKENRKAGADNEI